jgi:ribosomal protein S18 acetylase RimI-like enzyme
MQPADYEEALALWQTAEGVRLTEIDTKEHCLAFLDRNPGLSQVARDGQTLVAAALVGHDGRIGYLHHVAVAPTHRRMHIGSQLVRRCLDRLRKVGIGSAYAFVQHRNEVGHQFWKSLGWSVRDVHVMCLWETPSTSSPLK